MFDSVFSLKSGKQYQIFRQRQNAQNAEFLMTQVVGQSDYLMTRHALLDDEGSLARLTFIFENDPGLRNRNLVGARHLRHIRSIHVISRSLLLVKLGSKQAEVDDGYDDYGTSSYWTFITINGRTQTVDRQLDDILHHRASDEGLELGPWTSIQECVIKGKICRLLLYRQAAADLRKTTRQGQAVLVELTAKGEMLRSKPLNIGRSESNLFEKVLMNSQGRVLQVRIGKDNNSDDSHPKFTPED